MAAMCSPCDVTPPQRPEHPPYHRPQYSAHWQLFFSDGDRAFAHTHAHTESILAHRLLLIDWLAAAESIQLSDISINFVRSTCTWWRPPIPPSPLSPFPAVTLVCIHGYISDVLNAVNSCVMSLGGQLGWNTFMKTLNLYYEAQRARNHLHIHILIATTCSPCAYAAGS